MGNILKNVVHAPVGQADFGLYYGVTFSPAVNDVNPLNLMTFGFVMSDPYADCGATITTSYSACPSVSTIWSIK